RRTRRRRRFALQETLGYGIGKRIVEREQHDLLLRDVPSCVIGEAGTLGVVEFLRIGVFPIVAPAGVDVEHITGREPALLQPLRPLASLPCRRGGRPGPAASRCQGQDGSWRRAAPPW